MIQTCVVLDRGPGVVVRNENPSNSSVAGLNRKMQSCVAILMLHENKCKINKVSTRHWAYIILSVDISTSLDEQSSGCAVAIRGDEVNCLEPKLIAQRYIGP
jgi:hypothetical protein